MGKTISADEILMGQDIVGRIFDSQKQSNTYAASPKKK